MFSFIQCPLTLLKKLALNIVIVLKESSLGMQAEVDSLRDAGDELFEISALLEASENSNHHSFAHKVQTFRAA